MSTNTAPEIDLQNLKPHPLAAAFPRPTEEEKKRMMESVQKIGLVDPIVLLNGQILDGLSRYEVCTELGTTAHFREFGSKESDGTSPTDFVTAKNLAHRFLTTSQKAAIAEELVPFYQDEAKMTKTEATAHAAAVVNVSPSSVERAAKLKKIDPMGFNKVRTGTSNVTAATAESKEKEQERIEEAESQLLKPIREANLQALTKRHGEEFGVAFGNGVLLKSKAHLDQFLEMNAEDQKFILPLVLRKWEPKAAFKFLNRVLDGQSRLIDLVLQATAMKKGLKVLVDGYVVTARKAAEGEAV